MKKWFKRLAFTALGLVAAVVLLLVGGYTYLMVFGRGEPPAIVPAANTPLGEKYQEVLLERDALALRVKAFADSMANLDAALHAAGVAAHQAGELQKEGRKDESEKLAAEAEETLRRVQRQIALQRSVMKDALTAEAPKAILIQEVILREDPSVPPAGDRTAAADLFK